MKGPGGIISTPADQQTSQNDAAGGGGDTGLMERSSSTKPNGTTARTAVTTAAAARYSSPYQQLQATYSQPQVSQQRPTGPDRSVVSAAGGVAAIGGAAQVEKLPPETGKLSGSPVSAPPSRDRLCCLFVAFNYRPLTDINKSC